MTDGDGGAPLVLVSNRGPVTYQDDGSVKRGTGGLATALIGLASHRDAVWIASAMTDGDVEMAREHGGEAFEIEAPDGGEFRVRFVDSDPEAYDRFYNIFANPMLWFIQHYLWDQSNAPDIRRHEVEAFEFGYNVVNEDLAEAVLEEIDGVDEPVVMVHDYQLYTLPGMVRRARPGRVPAPLRAHPVDAVGRLARAAGEDPRRDLPRAAGQRHHRLPHALLPAQLPAVLPRPARPRRRHGARRGVRATTARCGCARTRSRSTSGRRRRWRGASGCAEFEEKLLARRREFSILRVDRADLSKNVLRGFTGFDIFLEQHPEFIERITFTAQLMPSRTDVPEYAEYLERIEALVAVVNHRHGTPDWMPINLKLRDDLDEAVASYKHYDVMMVNAMFDGMNLVAKEGPLVNERDGVSILSENTGAHEELGEFALCVNPFDVQELADAIHAALTMSPERAGGAGGGLEGDRHVARSGGLDRRADRGHPQEGAGGRGGGLRRPPRRAAGRCSLRHLRRPVSVHLDACTTQVTRPGGRSDRRRPRCRHDAGRS